MVAVITALLLTGALLAGIAGRGETAQSAVVGTILAPLNYVSRQISNIIDKAFGNLSPDAEYEKALREKNEEISDMRARLADYEDLKKQNELYREFLELKEEHSEYKFAEASVIARDSADIYKSFTINKGAASGIEVGDAVLYKKSFIGIIDKVYPDYSIVKTFLDPSFNVSAYEIISGEISYVTGSPSLAVNGKCKMANLSTSTEVSYGSIICTAGIGGKVPKGLVIGTVDEVTEEQTDISLYAQITPEVDIDELTECFVITDF